MAGAWTTLAIKDATGTSQTMRVWDESGSGAGPFSFGQMGADGLGSGGQLALNSSIAAKGTQASPSADYVGTTTAGVTAHAASDADNPLKIGSKALAGLSTATLVSAGQRSNAYSDLDGAVFVRNGYGLEDIVSGVAAITDGSSTSVIASSGAGIKTYLTTVIMANTSATAVTVDARDGAAGTVKATFPCPANTSGVICNLQTPLPGSAATAWCADPSAAASTVTVTFIGFKSKV